MAFVIVIIIILVLLHSVEYTLYYTLGKLGDEEGGKMAGWGSEFELVPYLIYAQRQ